jgi:hypothetical protein
MAHATLVWMKERLGYLDSLEFRVTQMKPQVKQGMCHTSALPFTLKSFLRQEKNYENSNISPCKNIIFIKIL